MLRQDLKSTYLSARTNLIKCFKLSATTTPLLLHRYCYSQYFIQMEAITKEQEKAIKRLNSALKNAHKHNIFIAGMDSDLLYATQQSIDNCTNDSDYSDVARCNQHSDEGSGHLYSENYQDSGGW